MAGVCYPLAVLPGLSPLFSAYIAGDAPEFYPVAPGGHAWMRSNDQPAIPPRPVLADLLEAQNHAFHAGPAAIANISKLRTGARAVVTGQQVALFGGPLYTLHKAASAIRLATEATRSTGVEHVPVFWLASEDHDFAEIDHVALAAPGNAPQMVRLTEHPGRASREPVGSMRLGPSVESALDEAASLLGEGPELDLLRRCYRPDATFAGAFAQWLATVFRAQGLIVFDAAGRAAHALGSNVLRAAITDADTLEELLLQRGRELESRGFHQQVLVKPGASLLFLLAEGGENEPHTRQALKRYPEGHWTAGRQNYSTEDLLAILQAKPERLSPNALLRPVFQDSVLPTAAYIGGPAEIAYFAQNAVLHKHILGRQTPVLPRLSATLLTAGEAETMEHDGIDLPDLFHMPLEELVQRTGARNLSPETKARLHTAGAAMTAELDALTEWLASMDPELRRPAEVATSKMRYQMNRLRRLAARREMERNAGIRRRIAALSLAVYPNGHLQERSLGAAAALARFGASPADTLIAAAGDPCPGHKLLVL